MILAKGADVNTPAGSGSTALLPAVEAGIENIVEMLLDSGADIGAAEDGGSTPLSAAVGKEIQRSKQIDSGGRVVSGLTSLTRVFPRAPDLLVQIVGLNGYEEMLLFVISWRFDRLFASLSYTCSSVKRFECLCYRHEPRCISPNGVKSCTMLPDTPRRDACSTRGDPDDFSFLSQHPAHCASDSGSDGYWR